MGGNYYLETETMNPAPQKEGKILCDLHAHPTLKANLEDIVNALQSPGMVGLTVKDIDRSGKDILRYEQALDLLPSKSFQEIDKGKLAKCGQGYFARTQEIQAGLHHVLALGWESAQYFPNFNTLKEAVKEIHAHKGIAILNHPFALAVDHNIRLPKSREEEELIQTAYGSVDEIEVHNAYCIDLIPKVLAMKDANRRAEELRLREFPTFIGTAGSDCHRRWNQVKITGIYLDKSRIEQKGMEGVKEAIIQGNFTRWGDAEAGPYVSRGGFLLGVAGDMLSLI